MASSMSQPIKSGCIQRDKEVLQFMFAAFDAAAVSIGQQRERFSENQPRPQLYAEESAELAAAAVFKLRWFGQRVDACARWPLAAGRLAL